MDQLVSARLSRSSWNPSTNVEEGSPVFTAASYMSPRFTSGLDSYARKVELDEEHRRDNAFEGAPDGRGVRRSSSRGRQRGPGELGGVAWDWRSRKWVGSSFDVQPAFEPDEMIPRTGRSTKEGKPSTKGVRGGRKSVQRGGQTGRMSERDLDGISEREFSDPRRESGQIVTRLRREKAGVRSRRRGYYVLDMRARRKVLRRDYLQRDMNSRRSSSDRLQGSSVGRSTPNTAVSLQAHQATKSFSLLTLEEYLKERALARQQRGEKFSTVTVDVGSPILAADAHLDEAYFEGSTRLKPRSALRKIPNLIACGDFPKLNDGANAQQLSKFTSALYGSDDAAGDDANESHFERFGCGMPWHWSSGHPSKDEGLMDYAGSCLPVSRRIGMKVISRSRPSHRLDSRVVKYTSERSVSSFDSDMETVPLMTEPEPFHEYSDDLAASSVELERATPRMEMHGKKFSRFKDNGRNELSVGKLEQTDVFDSLPVVRKVDLSGEKHRSLTQKYRPKNFKDIVGQGMVAQSLSNAILRGKIAPVYLFQGPRGTGKTTAARIFTAALNCLTIEELRPCGLCKECTAYNAGRNFDVREVDAAGNNEIESMRLLLKHLSLPPSSSRYKVFIIDECHLLTAEAWNALLKSLEEPPSYVVFILITTDPEQLPRTAISRCQKFLFSKIKDADIVLRLRKLALQENLEVELEALQLIASRADGSLRDAETSLDQLSLIGKRVSLAVVRELVGLIPDDRLAELLDLALSPETASTVKTIRDLMESGVEPLALISQLATLITDVLAGKKRTIGCRTMKVRKDEPERLRQALRILSDAEKQLRSCSDRITWLTAAFLQFAPNDFCLPPSSLGTSVTQSPMTFLDTSEKETLDLEGPGTRQVWQGDERRNPLIAYQLEPVPQSLPLVGKVETGTRKRLDNHSHNFSGPFSDKKIYPCNQSPLGGSCVKEPKASLGGSQPSVPLASSSSIRKLDPRDSSYMSPCTMDNIWRKVLEGSHLDVLRQLSRGEGKLLSLSVTEASALAHLEFRYPEHRAMAEKKKTHIANAFQVALGCPVEVRISLSSSQVEDNFLCRRGSPIVPGNAGQPNRHKRMISLPRPESKAHLADHDNTLLQDQRRISCGSFRKSSSSFRDAAPVPFSPQLRTFEHRKSTASLELEHSSHSRRSTDAHGRDNEGTLFDRGKSKEGSGRLIIANHHFPESQPAERKRGMGTNWNVPKGMDYMEVRNSGGMNSQNAGGISEHVHGQGLMSGPLNEYSRGKAERDSMDEPRSSGSSQEGNDASNNLEKDSSDFETEEKYGTSFLCWKGSRINDGKVKHQRLRRRRRTRFLLRFVPCAREEGNG